MRTWFIVGSKLMGIYFLYLALTNLPPSISFALSIFSNRSIIEGLPILAVFSSVFSGLVMLVFAFALLFKTEFVAAILSISDDNLPIEKSNLSAGIILIGIYIFCTKIGVLANIFAVNQGANKFREPFAATQPQGLAFSLDYIAPGVTLLASLGLIFGAKHISAFLEKERQNKTEQSVQPDSK